jgi:hypothetical protein
MFADAETQPFYPAPARLSSRRASIDATQMVAGVAKAMLHREPVPWVLRIGLSTPTFIIRLRFDDGECTLRNIDNLRPAMILLAARQQARQWRQRK